MAEILPMLYFQYIKNILYIKMFYKITPGISRENSYYILRVMEWFSFLWEFKFVEEIYTQEKMGVESFPLIFFCVSN